MGDHRGRTLLRRRRSRRWRSMLLLIHGWLMLARPRARHRLLLLIPCNGPCYWLLNTHHWPSHRLLSACGGRPLHLWLGRLHRPTELPRSHVQVRHLLIDLLTWHRLVWHAGLTMLRIRWCILRLLNMRYIWWKLLLYSAWCTHRGRATTGVIGISTHHSSSGIQSNTKCVCFSPWVTPGHYCRTSIWNQSPGILERNDRVTKKQSWPSNSKGPSQAREER